MAVLQDVIIVIIIIIIIINLWNEGFLFIIIVVVVVVVMVTALNDDHNIQNPVLKRLITTLCNLLHSAKLPSKKFLHPIRVRLYFVLRVLHYVNFSQHNRFIADSLTACMTRLHTRHNHHHHHNKQWFFYYYLSLGGGFRARTCSNWYFTE